MAEEQIHIGHVLRASTNGFDFGTRGNEIDERHSFGSFVLVEVARGDSECFAVGLIYAIRIADDPFVRELVMATEVKETTLQDQRKNRLIPVETLVLNVGYVYADGRIVHSMPPRPPLSLTQVHLMPPDWVHAFVQTQDFFRLVLNAGEVPSDDLLAASIRYAANFFGDPNERYEFLVACGRQVARLLTNDLKRLSHILNLIRPTA
ncbi:MAG: hypothetical protein AAFV33_02350 [Chloroflexota bacterium]